VLLGLKIDVDTERGAREGVPRLVEALARHGAKATFLFNVGPDRTGRALRLMLPGGGLSARAHYGWRTSLNGILLPGPDVGRRCAAAMRSVRDAGHEVGLRAWDHAAWRRQAAGADVEWTTAQLERGCARFMEIFGEPARVHAAPGWQMNAHAWRLTQRLGFDYASDTRGTEPFVPIRNAEIIDRVQIPTTLPTLDELVGRDGVTVATVAERLLDRSRDPLPTGHVYSLHAEVEGGRLLAVFESLLTGWRALGFELVALRDVFQAIERRVVPRCAVDVGTLPGRSGTLALQSRPFLA
jgi:peptidoglycan/xylan/chitin deacetylase (PgdA/CDA1 family)